MGKNKILLVEDDQNFRDVLTSYLEMHGYEVNEAEDGESGFNAFKDGDHDLVITDVMMPVKDGFTLAKEIREIDQEIPIIFLTAKALNQDVLEGFKIGGDDYVVKPFNSEELLYRIKAVTKRIKKKPDIFKLGHFEFNYPLRQLILYGESGEIKKDMLSPKEAHLLRMFCLNKNEVTPRSEALKKIWGDDNYFTARSMDVFVTKLRKYLAPDPDLEIVNIHGNGFRLVVKSELNQEDSDTDSDDKTKK